MSKKILLELSYDNLLANTRSNFDTGRDERASKVKIVNTIFVPAPNSDELQIEGEARTKSNSYQTRIIFENVIFKPDVDRETVSVMGTDGEEYHFNRINSGRSDVKVSCTCLDFYYRFAAFNHRDNALAAEPPKPYSKKTDRAPVNPSEVPGVCKHLIRLVEELEKNNIFA
jgi:hypothetical protein